MQHVLRTLVIVAAIALPGTNACAPTAPPAPPPPSAAPPAQFKPTVDSSKMIYVTPVEGVTTVARLVLADAIAAALRDARKPAVLSEKDNDKGPTVSGRVVDVQERDTVYWITAAWTLKSPAGSSLAEFRQQIVVDKTLWQTGAPEAINLMVADAGPMVAGMVRDNLGATALAAPPEPAAKKGTVKDAPKETATEMPKAPPGEAKPAAAPPPVAAAEPAKPPQIRPKTIPRRPAHPPARPEPLTAKRPDAPLETAALESPRAAERPAAEMAPLPAPPTATGRPVLLGTSPPPKQPPEKPVDEVRPRKPAKQVLMPVPGEAAAVEPEPPPVAWTRPSFLIKAVEGAPGDGNLSLMRAMKAALRKRDLTVTEDPRQAGYVIHGRVQVGPPVNGRQQAKIVWAVNTVSGEEIGKAVQENAVAAGSLDGAWGRLAEIVSAAAVTGIQELFGLGDKQSSRNDLPRLPPLPTLPQVPGRAPPPSN